MPKSVSVTVNPQVLIWAREEMELTVDEVINRAGSRFERLRVWERDGKNIPYSVLEALATIYKRQPAVFFLSQTPQHTKKPTDHRNLSKRKAGFSSDTLLAIRRTSRYLEAVRELIPQVNWQVQYGWMKKFTGKQEYMSREAQLLREVLDAPLAEQFKQRLPDNAFRYWRNKVEEKLGIFVFQFSMPENELDGFSYAFDQFPYAIVINNKYPSSRKTFTLFHEFAHILRRTPGVCFTAFSSKEGQRQDIEFECNRFAGEFLVPTQSLKSADTVEMIFMLARDYGISGEVYLRRLWEEKKISNSDFFDLLVDVRKKSTSFKKEKRHGFPSLLIQSKSTRGRKLYDLVTSAALADKISFTTASDILGLKVGSISS